jgi:catechol 2,3-dioxygenase-like lactoylglutathione lyase family enzyme
MKSKISLITFGARDLERMIAFYRDGLGFPLHNYSPGDDMVMFRLARRHGGGRDRVG